MTTIAWTDETWNPVTGCTKVSEGCAHCYAEGIARRFWRGRPFSDVQCHPERLDIPLHWRKPRMVFVDSMSDTFHEMVPEDFILHVLASICRGEKHTYQLLTKRPERMKEIISNLYYDPPLRFWAYDIPLPNLWLGVTAENQKRADERIPILLQIPAAVRFLSLEPLLEDIDLEFTEFNEGYQPPRFMDGGESYCVEPNIIKQDIVDWVIVGCESGPKRRECKLEWIKSVIDQCAEAGVRCFVKQIPINGKVSHNPEEWPDWARVRQTGGE